MALQRKIKRTPQDDSKPLAVVKIESYKRFFDSEDGKTILYDLMVYGNFVAPTYNPDPQKTPLNEGRREVILYILEQCNRDIADIVSFIAQQEEVRREVNSEY